MDSPRRHHCALWQSRARRVRIGLYYSAVENPYPWVSGIYPVAGPNAYAGRALNRWGIAVRLRADY